MAKYLERMEFDMACYLICDITIMDIQNYLLRLKFDIKNP